MGVTEGDQALIEEFAEAAKNNDIATVKRLMQQLNGKTEAGDTALHLAAAKGNIEIVSTILEQGTALENDARDSDDATPMMLAASEGHLEVVHKLIKYGADPNLVDRLGWSALHHAAANGHSVLVSYLMNKCKKSLIFARDSSGCSPLWLAANKADPETVRLLLLQGADPSEVNDEDVSVYQAAREAETEEGDEANVDCILDMLDVASERWTEEKEKLGEPVEADEIDARPAKVLDGTMDGPSLPVGDEGQPLVNDDAAERLFDNEGVDAVRKVVTDKLKLEEGFVESYLTTKGGMVTVEI